MPSIAIVGFSGTGKTTSIGNFPEVGIKGLEPKETIIVNVANKDLPFRGWKKNYVEMNEKGGNLLTSSDATIISKMITYVSEKRPEIKNIVIDDGQFIMAFEFMRRAKESGLTNHGSL